MVQVEGICPRLPGETEPFSLHLLPFTVVHTVISEEQGRGSLIIFSRELKRKRDANGAWPLFISLFSCHKDARKNIMIYLCDTKRKGNSPPGVESWP